MTEQKLVMTIKEVCSALGVSRTCFLKLRSLGVFKALPYIGRNQKYSRQSVLDYVNQTPKQEK